MDEAIDKEQDLATRQDYLDYLAMFSKEELSQAISEANNEIALGYNEDIEGYDDMLALYVEAYNLKD